jgi:hypothetical protein
MPEKTCFVIAPIGDEGSAARKRSDRVFTYVIEPAARQCGYMAVRADKILKPGIITDQVIQQVINAPMAVADLSGHNANAFYELAVRHMVKKPLVQMITKGERIPFDVAASRVLFYDEPELETVEKTSAELVEHIRSAESGADNVDNPISVSVDLQALRQSGEPAIAQLAELVQNLSAGIAALHSDVADLKNRESGPVIGSFSRSGGMKVGEGWSLENASRLVGGGPVLNLRSERKDDPPQSKQ